MNYGFRGSWLKGSPPLQRDAGGIQAPRPKDPTGLARAICSPRYATNGKEAQNPLSPCCLKGRDKTKNMDQLTARPYFRGSPLCLAQTSG